MVQVLDYSAGFPGAQAIKAAGYSGAVRYIGFPGRRKCTTAAELADFTAHGIGMALVFEDTVTDWRGGFAAGQRAGQLARTHANSIGFPTGRPIYIAIDQDVVSTGEFDTMLDYLRGANGPLGGPGMTGVYGETDVINRARAAGVAAWYWDTTAWSRGVKAPGIHLFQHVGTVTVGGIGCDINDVLLPDWGQHTLEDTVLDWTTVLKDWDTATEAQAYVWLLAARKDAGAARALAEAQAQQIAALTGQVAGLMDAMTQLAAKQGLDVAAIEAAVENGVEKALEEGTVDVNVTVANRTPQGDPS